MGSTFASLQCHVVFSTKDRSPIIRDDLRARFREYLGGTIPGLDAYPESVGGVADHVHLLFGFRTSQSVADLVRETKKESTKWCRQHLSPGFTWQEGYAAFTVGSLGLDSVKKYIANQEEHHAKVDFLDELRDMLRDGNVPFEERFLV